MMNHPDVLAWADATAQRLLKEHDALDPETIEYAYRLTLGRAATDAEREVISDYLKDYAKPQDAWVGIIHALFSLRRSFAL